MTGVTLDRERHQAQQRQRDLVAMQDSVTTILARGFPALGRDGVVIGEAVAEGLLQLVLAGGYADLDLEHAKNRWVFLAERRVIDALRTGDEKRRDNAPLEEHASAIAALAASASGELAGVSEAHWRIRELCALFRGDARRWLEAWFDQLLATGRQPRGIGELLDWSPGKTESVSRHTREQLVAYTERRVRGEVCHDRRAVLDHFILATKDGATRETFDDTAFVALLVHVAGCEDCRAAWHARRRHLLGRCLGVLTVPFGHVAAAAAALRAKLTGVFGSAHAASHTVHQRAGVGGAALTGGGAATITGKATTICVAVACAAGAGGTALVGAGSVIVPGISAPHHHHTTARPATARLASATQAPPPATTTLTVAQPASTPTQPAPTVTAAQTTTQPAAPGDLPGAAPASTGAATATAASTSTGAAAGSPSTTGSSGTPSSAASTSTPRRAAARSAPPAGGASGCAPGDLGC